MNIMEINGYKAKIDYDSDLDQFRGTVKVHLSYVKNLKILYVYS